MVLINRVRRPGCSSTRDRLQSGHLYRYQDVEAGLQRDLKSLQQRDRTGTREGTGQEGGEPQVVRARDEGHELLQMLV